MLHFRVCVSSSIRAQRINPVIARYSVGNTFIHGLPVPGYAHSHFFNRIAALIDRELNPFRALFNRIRTVLCRDLHATHIFRDHQVIRTMLALLLCKLFIVIVYMRISKQLAGILRSFPEFIVPHLLEYTRAVSPGPPRFSFNGNNRFITILSEYQVSTQRTAKTTQNRISRYYSHTIYCLSYITNIQRLTPQHLTFIDGIYTHSRRHC